MAVYFAPNDPYASRSASFGSSIGKSLSDTLNMLTQNKQRQLQAQKQAAGTAEGLLSMGVPPEVAEKIALMPQGHQEMFMKQFFGSQAFMPQQGGEVQGQEQSPLAGLLGGQQDQYAPEQIQQQQVSPQQQLLERMQAPMEQQLQQGGTDDLLSRLAPETQQALQESAPPEAPVQQQAPIAPLKKADRSYLMKRASIEGMRDSIPSNINAAIRRNELQRKPVAKKSFQELLATPRPTAADRSKMEMMRRKEALEAKKMDFAERKFAYKKQESVDKSTQKDYDAIKDKYKGAIENDWRLDKLESSY